MCRLMCTCMYNVICIHMQARIVCQSVSWSLVEYYSYHFACCFSTAMLRCFTLSSMCVSLWSIPCSSCPIAILHSASSCDVTVSTAWAEWLTFVPWTVECCSETQGTTNWDTQTTIMEQSARWLATETDTIYIQYPSWQGHIAWQPYTHIKGDSCICTLEGDKPLTHLHNTWHLARMTVQLTGLFLRCLHIWLVCQQYIPKGHKKTVKPARAICQAVVLSVVYTYIESRGAFSSLAH